MEHSGKNLKNPIERENTIGKKYTNFTKSQLGFVIMTIHKNGWKMTILSHYPHLNIHFFQSKG